MLDRKVAMLTVRVYRVVFGVNWGYRGVVHHTATKRIVYRTGVWLCKERSREEALLIARACKAAIAAERSLDERDAKEGSRGCG